MSDLRGCIAAAHELRLWPSTCIPTHIMNKALLIVDDEPAILGSMSEYFRAEGYIVHAAQELEEAAALVSKYAYSLVIADLCLTSVQSNEGFYLIEDIRTRSPKTKIMLLSGRMKDELGREALRRGADAVLCKPQPLPMLRALADNLLEVN